MLINGVYKTYNKYIIIGSYTTYKCVINNINIGGYTIYKSYIINYINIGSHTK